MDNTPPFSDEVRRYLELLLQRIWLLALSAVLAGGVAYFLSLRMTPVYRATTLIRVNEAPSNKAIDYTAVMTSERLAKTYAEEITTRPVLVGVVQRLDLALDVEALQKAIEVSPMRETLLIRVDVENANPNLAALLANTLVAEFAERNLADQASRFAASKQNLEAQLTGMDRQIEETSAALNNLAQAAENQAERDRLEAALAQYRLTYTSLLQSYEQVRMTEAQTTSTVVQKEPAIPPILPVRPRVFINTALAAVMGLLLAVGIIFTSDALDDTLRDPAQVERQLGLPVLGLIARHEHGRPVAAAQPRSPVAEAFRGLRTNLQFAGLDRPLRTILVTSPLPKEGKSTVAANLAVVLAQGGRRAVLIDADLRRPCLHRLLGLANREGLTGLFLRMRHPENGPLNLVDYFQPTETPGLQVLTTGSLPPNPAELLGSESMLRLLERVGEETHSVVIDSPPLLAVTDAAVLASRVDGVILVVKPGETKLAACQQAVEQLRRVGANLLGVVLNDVVVKRSHYNYKYGGYYSSYASPHGEAKQAKAPARVKNESGD